MQKKYKPEKRIFQDEKTGATIWQMTDYPAIHYNFGYLGTPSFSPDSKTLYFLSDRASENYDIFSADIDSGEITQLTNSTASGAISPCSQGLSPDGKWLYFTRGSSWISLNLETLEERLLIDFPNASLGVFGGFTTDGKYTALKVKHKNMQREELFTVEMEKGDKIKKIASILNVQRQTAKGYMIGALLIPDTINCPIAYGEFESNIRIIDWDGKRHECLIGEFGKTFLTHPVRFSDENILFIDWQERILKTVSIVTREIRVIANTSAFHATVNRDQSMIACDTAFPDIGIQLISPETGQQRTLCHSKASNQGNGWSTGGIVPAKMLDYSRVIDPGLGPQWTHPHVSFSPDNKKVCYSSNYMGFPQVYIAFIV